jgi:hypothetical protein
MTYQILVLIALFIMVITVGHVIRRIEQLSDFDRPFCATLPPAPSVQPPAPSVQPPAPSVQPPVPSVQPPAPSVQPPAPSVQPPAPAPSVKPPTPSTAIQTTDPPFILSSDRKSYHALNEEGTRQYAKMYTVRNFIAPPYNDTIGYTKRAADYGFPFPINPNAEIPSIIVGYVNVIGGKSITEEQLKDLMFFYRKKDTYSFDYWLNCASYGKAYLAEENVAFVQFVPQTPQELQTYALNVTCDDRDLFPIIDKFRALYGPGNERYRHVFSLIPKPPAVCTSWAGKGMFCTDNCRLWLTGSLLNQSLWYHEFGHNLRLHHSQTPTYEYGDNSSVMGQTGNVTFNAIDRFQLGWGKPNIQYIYPSVAPFEVTINSLDQTIENNMLILHSEEQTFYLSYRTIDYANKDGVVNGVQYTNKLSIHKYRYNMLIGLLAVSEQFVLPEHNFNFIEELLNLTTAINIGISCQNNKAYDPTLAFTNNDEKMFPYSVPGLSTTASVDDCGAAVNDNEKKVLLKDDQFAALLAKKKERFIQIFKSFKDEMKIPKYTIELKRVTSNPATATISIARFLKRKWSFSAYVKDVKRFATTPNSVELETLAQTANNLDDRTPDIPLIDIVNFLNSVTKFDGRRKQGRSQLKYSVIDPAWLMWIK